MMAMSSIPAATIASMPYASTGLFATGMSCLAEVYVKGRMRVPFPPDRINPFIAPLCIQLSPVPCPGSPVGFLLHRGPGTGDRGLVCTERPHVLERDRHAERVPRLRQGIINQVT